MAAMVRSDQRTRLSVPQKISNSWRTEQRRSQGTNARKAVRPVGGGSAAASSAPPAADSCANLQVVFGLQTRRRRTSDDIETSEPTMSTSVGPNQLLTTNC